MRSWHVHVCVRICARTCTRMLLYVYAYHMYVYVYAYAHVRVRVCACACTCTRMRTYVCAHAYRCCSTKSYSTEVKLAMEYGHTVILINAQSIYTNFYDVFNRHFSSVTGNEPNTLRYPLMCVRTHAKNVIIRPIQTEN